MATLQEICVSVCERAGIASALVDVSQLPDVEVGGLLITNQYPASQTLQALGQAYLFDVVEFDGIINFVPRGGSSVATITEDDMLDDDRDIEEESKRADAIGIPRMLHLNYHDIEAAALSSAKQTSERAGDRRALGELSLQTAVVMTSQLAARVVDIAHKVMIEDQKGEIRFALPTEFLFLTPGDIVTLSWRGKTERCRIHQCDILDGYQEYVCLRDRVSAYSSTVDGIAQPTPPTPPSIVVGPTIIVPLDIPLLRDVDDAVGLAYYVAVCGVSESWPGCIVELSRDGGSNYPESKEALYATIIGELTAVLPDHPHEYPDNTNSMQVHFYPPNPEVQPAALEDMLNGANLIAVGAPDLGWELMNFGGVVEATNGQDFTLSAFLRGRKYTAARLHEVGEFVVILNRDLLGFEAANLTDLGQQLTFRATTSGESVDTGTVTSIPSFAGMTQNEYPPAMLEAYRDGSNVVITWAGVGRLGAGTSTAHGAKFTGYRVLITGSVSGSIQVDTQEKEVTQNVSSLTGDLVIEVYQVNELTGLTNFAGITVP
jgi:hypothetical protein